MEDYNPAQIEGKWQDFWEEKGLFKAEDPSPFKKVRGPKKYILIEFPYPSSDGLHVGHVRSYAALDAVARKARMEGFNVLYPIGWDAFGLPTENYAIKTGIHPEVATQKNIANFKRQLKMLGISFDWSREINTTDPDYYKWTQWIFLKFFEKGLAYQAKIPINWCPSCKIGLANEEVIDGKCERCGAETEQREIKQWLLQITKYADRLIDDLKKVDYLEKIKTQQINWIGKSVGTEIDFKVDGLNEFIKVFTTRADTLFGVTAVVLAPEHPLVKKIVKDEQKKEVEKYIEESREKSEFERTKLEKEKTGVFTGAFCINPGNNEKVPIWIGDYVIATYGGGAVMMVPAHDYRDFDFAKRFNLPIRQVITPTQINTDKNTNSHELKEAFVDYGKLINSGEFNSLKSEKAIEKITEWLEKNKLGKKTVQYKLRDWIFSRQHYWGEPIPLVFCENCAVKIKNQKSKIKKGEFSEGELLNPGWIAVSENNLPVELPYIKKYQPTGTGESPLAAISEWVNVKCPKCNGPAKRETDTMPNWAGSSWYYLAYTMLGNQKSNLKNQKLIWDKEKIKYWMPVDWYNGGMEHTTLHLLYSRFIYKFLWDIGVVPKSAGSEPYQKRTSQGIVLAEDNRKMSKSFGNVINPDEIVKRYGADTLRVYEMFMGPFGETIVWNTKGVEGAHRFLNKLWDFVMVKIKGIGSKEIKTPNEGKVILNKTIKKVSEDIENFKFNTIISSLMELLNFFRGGKSSFEKIDIKQKDLEKILILIYPFAPHIAEEMWEKLGYHKGSISLEKWPKPDPKFLKEETFELIIQVNGKMRDKVSVPMNISEEEAKELTLGRETVKKWRGGKIIKKIIFVKNKLINIVI